MKKYFIKWAIPWPLFFFIFRLFNTVDSKQMFGKSLPMPGFEPWISGVRGDRCTNWATTVTSVKFGGFSLGIARLTKVFPDCFIINYNDWMKAILCLTLRFGFSRFVDWRWFKSQHALHVPAISRIQRWLISLNIELHHFYRDLQFMIFYWSSSGTVAISLLQSNTGPLTCKSIMFTTRQSTISKATGCKLHLPIVNKSQRHLFFKWATPVANLIKALRS